MKRSRKNKKDIYLNSIFETKEGYLIKIIEYNSTSEVRVIFENGLEIWSSINRIKRGDVLNPNHPILYGIGFLGVMRKDMKKGVFYKKCYDVWFSMLRRCYDTKHNYNPTYKDVSVCEEWHNFQNFTQWFEQNYDSEMMKRWHLDKDILCPSCRTYSPETCCFVPQEINNLIVNTKRDREWLPQGVFYHSRDGYFTSSFKNKYLGRSYLSEDMFNVFKIEKEDCIHKLAEQYKNELPKIVFDMLSNYTVKHNGDFPTLEFCKKTLLKEIKEIKISYTLEDILEAVQYGFDYRVNSMNDGKHVPLGNTLQWLMAWKKLNQIPEEFKEKLKNRTH